MTQSSSKPNERTDGDDRKILVAFGKKTLGWLCAPLVKFLSLLNDIQQTVRKESPPRNWGLLFIAIALMLFFIYWHMPPSPHPAASPSKTAELVNTLANAFLISGFFSLLLGMKEFTEYTRNILASLLMNNTYLEKLSLQEKKDLRGNLDTFLYGKRVTDAEFGPYKFISEQYESVYNVPYRTDFSENFVLKAVCPYEKESVPLLFPCIGCGNRSTDEKYWCTKGTTKYTLYFSHIIQAIEAKERDSKYANITIPMGFNKIYYNPSVIKEIKNCYSIDELSTNCDMNPMLQVIVEGSYSAGEKGEKEDVKIVYTTRQDDKGKMVLIYDEPESSGVNKGNITDFITRESYDVTVKFNTQKVNERIDASVNVNLELCGKKFLNGEARITIHEASLSCKKDNVQHLHLSYPTWGLNAVFRIEDPNNDYLFHPYWYVQDSAAGASPDSMELNHVAFSQSGWLIKGHGYSLVWVSVRNGPTARSASGSGEK